MNFCLIRLEVCVKVGCEIFYSATKYVIRMMLNKLLNLDNVYIVEFV